MNETCSFPDAPHPDPSPIAPSEPDDDRALRAALARSLAEIGLRSSGPGTGGPERGRPGDPCILVLIVDALEASGIYRVLRRLAPDEVDASASHRDPGTSVVVVVDVETTGLDHRSDEVIEIGLLRFEHVDGAVTRVTGEMSALREPCRPISPEITRLTGITPAAVAGHAVDPDAVADMLLGADLVVAHNAAFDRPFCEALHPGFASLPWACSVQEVDWTAAGFEGARLGHLLLQSGSFHRGHRALDDCRALLHLLRLARPLPSGEAAPLLRSLVDSAMETRRRVWADGASFDRKDLLKARGYRWHPGGPTTRKAWWREVAEDDYRAEAEFLHREVYCQPVPLRTERVTARDRYRSR